MKRLACVLVIVLGVVPLVSAVAETDSRRVTGSGVGVVAPGPAVYGVALNGLQLGTGVFIESDGSATGTFNAVLSGTLLPGQPQEITVDGKVSAGSVGPEGDATFTGTATVDLGDGTPPLPNVPFSVTAKVDGVVLALDSVTLPAAALPAGSVTIE